MQQTKNTPLARKKQGGELVVIAQKKKERYYSLKYKINPTPIKKKLIIKFVPFFPPTMFIIFFFFHLINYEITK